MTTKDAPIHVQAKRPCIRPNDGFLSHLLCFETTLNNTLNYFFIAKVSKYKNDVLETVQCTIHDIVILVNLYTTSLHITS